MVDIWDHKFWIQWHHQNWSLCFWVAFGYAVLALFAHHYHLNGRSKSRLLALWSATFGLISLATLINLVPKAIHSIFYDGINQIICENRYSNNISVLFWMWFFSWSMIVALLDFIFMMRKRVKFEITDTFLRLSTLVNAFVTFSLLNPLALLVISANTVVNGLEYLRNTMQEEESLTNTVLSTTLRALQTGEVFLGIYVFLKQFISTLTEEKCETTLGLSAFLLLIYFLRLGFLVTKFTSNILAQFSGGDKLPRQMSYEKAKAGDRYFAKVE